MNITLTHNDNEVILSLAGRLDTATSMQAADDIEKALLGAQAARLQIGGDVSHVAVGADASKRQDIPLTCDASQLEYISSSGLRILLGLAKKYPRFRITEVQPDVYYVLETTGFTKIMPVERALRRMSIDGRDLIGSGGVGTVYRIDGDTIIKVFREGTTMGEVQREISMAKEAFVMGMPTAISFDVVRVGSQYGLVYELLEADTLSACIRRSPEKIDEYARKYANLFRQMHAIEVPTDSNVPSAVEREREQVRHIRRYFSQEDIDMLLRIVDAIPEGNRLLHLDLQTKNAMVQDGELMLIDMGEVGYGHPMLDLGHAHSAMAALADDYEKIIGLPQQLANDVWCRAMDYYFSDLPAEVAEQRKAQIAVVSCVRNFSWLSLSDSFPEEVVNHCRNLFAERITNRRDYILDVCKTFKDWTL